MSGLFAIQSYFICSGWEGLRGNVPLLCLGDEAPPLFDKITIKECIAQAWAPQDKQDISLMYLGRQDWSCWSLVVASRTSTNTSRGTFQPSAWINAFFFFQCGERKAGREAEGKVFPLIFILRVQSWSSLVVLGSPLKKVFWKGTEDAPFQGATSRCS